MQGATAWVECVCTETRAHPVGEVWHGHLAHESRARPVFAKATPWQTARATHLQLRFLGLSVHIRCKPSEGYRLRLAKDCNRLGQENRWPKRMLRRSMGE